MRQATPWVWVIVMAVLSSSAVGRALGAEIFVGAGESVQAAIDKAPAGATITLAPGVFRERITIAKALTLQGAGWEKTTIGPEANLPLTQREKDAFFAALEATNDPQERTKIAVAFANRRPKPTLVVRDGTGVVLRQLKVRGPAVRSATEGISSDPLVLFQDATGSMSECAVVGPFWNGIAIQFGSELKLEKSLVAAMWGTGVAAGQGTNLQMSDCDIRNCYHRCVTLVTGDATVERCRISGSAWHGIRYDGCSPTIRNNQIFGNARSGIYASGRTSATVVENVFWRNEMNAMSCWFSNADNIERNTIVGNLREGISVIGGAKPTLTRNVFVGNPIAVTCAKTTMNGKSGGETPSGDPTLAANFFFENPKPMQDGLEAKPLPPGNQLADPKVAGAGENFRLAADSPARQSQAGAADPIALASPFPTQPGETLIIPDSAARDSVKWKQLAARE